MSTAPEPTAPAPEQLPRWFGSEGLFGELSAASQQALLGALTPERYAPGELLFAAGDPADALLYVAQGQLKVFRPDGPDGVEVQLAVRGPHDDLGELNLLKRGARSASARATEALQCWRLPIDAVDELLERDPASATLYRRVGLALVRQSRRADDDRVRSMEELASSAKLLITVIAIQSGTLLAAGVMSGLFDTVSSSTLLLLGYLVFITFIGVFYTRSIKLPMSAFGLKREGWRPALKQALWVSALVMVLCMGVKWALIQWVPAYGHLPLLDPLKVTEGHGRSDVEQWRIFGYSVIGYTLAGGFQELYARGMLQGQLYRFFKHRSGPWPAIVVSNLLFGSIHVAWSIPLMVISFFGGLLWGWMYSREENLLGVTVSHILLGIWLLMVLNLPSMYAINPFGAG